MILVRLIYIKSGSKLKTIIKGEDYMKSSFYRGFFIPPPFEQMEQACNLTHNVVGQYVNSYLWIWTSYKAHLSPA